MKRIGKKTIAFVAAVVVLLVGSSLAAGCGMASEAAEGDGFTVVEPNEVTTSTMVVAEDLLSVREALEVDGVRLAGLTLDEASKTVVARVVSKEGGSPDDAWARMMIERELGMRKQAGDLEAETVTVEFVDEVGNALYAVRDMTIEPVAQSGSESLASTAAAEVRGYIDGELGQKGITLALFGLNETADGANTVELTVIVTSGQDRADQINWVVRELLGKIRMAIEDKGGSVDLFRTSILEQGTNRPLVEFVSRQDSVRAWHASDVPASWAISQPAPLEAADTSEP